MIDDENHTQDNRFAGDRRTSRPKMSYGSIVALATLIFMGLSSGVGGLIFITKISDKLDNVSDKILFLGDVKGDVTRLQTHIVDIDSHLEKLGNGIQRLFDLRNGNENKNNNNDKGDMK